MTRRLLICAVLACVGAAIATPAAEAVKTPICGAKDADGNAILGSLALNDNSSTIKSYGTGKGDRRLALLFDVTGCTLPAGTKIAPGQVTLLPAKTGDDLAGQPNVAVSVEAPDPTGVAATIGLKLDEIDPGTHAGIVRIHVPQYLHDSFTPISESRTGWWVWPLLLGLAGALAGLVWGVGLHFADTIAVKFSWRQGVLLGVLALGAGLAAGYGYWHNQEVWTLGENGWPTVVSGFTASTAGALAGVTAALFKPKEAVDTKTADDKAAAGKKAIGEPA